MFLLRRAIYTIYAKIYCENVIFVSIFLIFSCISIHMKSIILRCLMLLRYVTLRCYVIKIPGGNKALIVHSELQASYSFSVLLSLVSCICNVAQTSCNMAVWGKEADCFSFIFRYFSWRRVWLSVMAFRSCEFVIGCLLDVLEFQPVSP